MYLHLSFQSAIKLLSIVLLFLCSNFAFSENCYVWTSEDGVKHFGSIPPPDVAVETVECKAAPSSSSSEDTGPTEAETLAQQRKAREQREAQCKTEKQRLNTLRTSGTQIRMKNPDGSIKYLSKEEVAAEIGLSEGFIAQNCR